MRPLLFGAFLFLVSLPSFAQNINTASNFPDPAFRSIVEDVMGVAPGGEFTAAEAASVNGLIYAFNSGITDLTGIEYFTSLTTLYAHYNALTSLDLSQNAALQDLYIQANELTSLTLSPSAPLRNVLLHYNHFTDVSFIATHPEIGAGDTVNISFNDLNTGDSADVITLQNALGSGLIYTPQRNIPDFEPIAADQNINTATRIPDPAFRSIVQGVFSVGPDDVITPAEAAAFTGFIYAFNSGITDLTGIEYFTNLDTLYAHYNSLTSIDLSQNTALRRAFLSYNELASIDLGSNTNMEDVYLQGNELSSVVLSASAPIRTLLLHVNHLTDVSDLLTLPNLGMGDVVNISSNDLDLGDSEDVLALQERLGAGLTYSPQNGIPSYEPVPAGVNINTATRIPDPAFRSIVQGIFGASPTDIITEAEAAAHTGLIYAYNAGVTDLTGIEYFTGLDTLYAHYNSLTSVDLSQNAALRRVFLSYNDLNTIDLSQNTALEEIYLQGNSLASVVFPETAPLRTILLHFNNLTDVSNLLELVNPGPGDVVNISSNDLDLLDSDDIIELQNRLGTGLTFSPQRGFSVFTPVPSTVNINNASRIPDPLFRGLVQDIFAAAPDEIITTTQALQEDGLIWAFDLGITDLTGIGYFANLDTLYVHYNSLSSIDLSGNTALRRLFLNYNDLTSIDLSNQMNLQDTFLQGNELTSVVLPDSSAMRRLVMHTNRISDLQFLLDYPGLASLTQLDVRHNALTENDLVAIATISGVLGSNFQYTVTDTLPPVLNCPDSMVVEANQATGAVVSFATITASDQIDPFPVIEFNPPEGTVFPFGTTVVSVTATDAAGFVSSCTFSLTVLDTSAPELTYPDSVTVEATEPGGAVVTYPAITISDTNDPSPTLDVSPPDGSLFPLGTTIVSVTGTDSEGNVTTGSFPVVVEDTQAPELVVPPQVTVEASDSSGAVVNYPGVDVTDTVDASPVVSFNPESGSVFSLGLSVVTVSALDASGNLASDTFQVMVEDTVAPILDLPSLLTVEASDSSGAVVNYPGVDVTDTVDASPVVSYNPESGSVFPLGESTVSVTATDASGNVASGTFAVVIEDTVAPLLVLPSSYSVEATEAAGAIVTYPTIGVSDSVDAAPTWGVTPADGSLLPPGETIVSVTAADASGNVASGTFAVVIEDTVAPLLVLPSSYSVEATEAAGAIVTYPTIGVSDSVDAAPTWGVTPADGSLLPPGVTIVSVTAADASGNVASGTFAVIVEDTIAPTLECPETITVNASSAQGGFVTFSAPVATDTVDPAPTVQTSPESGSQFPLGTTTVQVTATDASGNVSTCTFDVEVVDVIPPVLSIGGLSELRIECNVDTYDESVWLASAFDQVDGGVPVIMGGDSVDTSTVGMYTVTFDASDQAGNPAEQQSRTVIVEDTLAPQITGLQNYSVVQDAACSLSTAVPVGGVSVSDAGDASPVVITTITEADGTVRVLNGLPGSSEAFKIGSSDVSIYTEDSSGNSGQASFTVSVESRTFINLLALSIQNGAIEYLTDTQVYVYDMKVGSCADMADGNSDGLMASSFYADVFTGCAPAFQGSLDDTGMATVGVNADTPYLVLLWIDADNDGQASAGDRYVGRVVSGISCGETLNTYLIDYHYTVFASNSVQLLSSSRVTGDVATEASVTDNMLSSNGEITLNSNASIIGNLLGDTIHLNRNTSVSGNIHTNGHTIHHTSVIAGFLVETLKLTLPSPVPSLPAITPGLESIRVDNQETLTLEPGEYDTISLNRGNSENKTTLYLTGGVYQINQLHVGTHAQVICMAPTIICVKERVRVLNFSYLGPAEGSELLPADVEVYIYKDNESFRDSIQAMTVGRYSTVSARVFAPNGAILIGDSCNLWGRFVSRWFRVGSRTQVQCDSIKTFPGTD